MTTRDEHFRPEYGDRVESLWVIGDKTNEFRTVLIETLELIEPLALIEALEAITAQMPIGDVDTHRARDKVEKLRKLHEVSKLPVKAGD